MCCVNCSEEHSAKSRDCKTWKIEKEVLHVKFTQGIGFPEARQIANSKFTPPTLTSTYSSITKSTSNKSTQCFDASTQTEPPKTVANVPTPVSVASKQPSIAPNNLPTKALTAPPTKQNIPNYKPQQQRTSNSTNTTSHQKEAKVNKTPRQRIDLNTGGLGKGSNDPINRHNRFEHLPIEVDMEEEEDGHLSRPPIPPKPPSVEKKIVKITSPEKTD